MRATTILFLFLVSAMLCRAATYVITGTSSATVNLNPSDSLYVASGANWTGAVSVGNNAVLYIESGATVSLGYSFNFNNGCRVTNYGNLNASTTSVASNSKLYNYGNLNTGYLTVNLNGTLVNYGSGVINVTYDFNQNGIFKTHGLVNVGKNMSMNSTVPTEVYGLINITSSLSINADVIGDNSGCGAFKIGTSNVFQHAGDFSTTGTLDICPDFATQNGTVGSYTSCAYTGSSCSTLDVTFTGLEINDNLLIWNVASEENCKNYEVLASKDGNNFVTIRQFVPCEFEGTSGQYSVFISPDEFEYYQVKHIASDGRPVYSGIIKDNNLAVGHLEIYPNPAKSISDLQLELPSDFEPISVTIMDLYGGVIEQVSADDFMASSISFEQNDLKDGVYILAVSSQSAVLSEKIIVKSE